MFPTKTYHGAILTDVYRNDESDIDDWNWRRELIGITGRLHIFECHGIERGKQFVYFVPDEGENDLQTGVGILSRVGKSIRLVTKNSTYEFLLGEKEQ